MNDLEIIDLVIGEGKSAEKGALISVHYVGCLADGTQFDSSIERNLAFQCVIGTGRVIKGWDQGVLGVEAPAKGGVAGAINASKRSEGNPMKVGGKRKLIVPYSLAYGKRKMGDKIPAKSDLTFEIELLEVLTRED
jgi:peptidylprolyl isomerase